MKVILLVGDGMAAPQFPHLLTPIQAANTFWMDYLANDGASGQLITSSPILGAGTETAHLKILGLEPDTLTMPPRAVLEASGADIPLAPADWAWRASLGTYRNGTRFTVSPPNPDTVTRWLKSEPIASILQSFQVTATHLGCYRILFNSHALTSNVASQLETQLQSLLQQSPLAGANSIWLWGGGQPLPLHWPRFQSRFPGRNGAIIADSAPLLGIAKQLHLDPISPWKLNPLIAHEPLSDRLARKAELTLQALDSCDLILVHNAEPDDQAHEGSWQGQVNAISAFDEFLVGPIFRALYQQKNPVRLVILSDHLSDSISGSHLPGPVPFSVWGKGVVPDHLTAFSEPQAASGSLGTLHAENLLDSLFQNALIL